MFEHEKNRDTKNTGCPFFIMKHVLRVPVCLCLSLSGHCEYIDVIAFSEDLPSARSIVRLSGNRG